VYTLGKIIAILMKFPILFLSLFLLVRPFRQIMAKNAIGKHNISLASIGKHNLHTTKSTSSRINVTMQGGQALAGMQGTNNNHMSGSSQLMVPGFPLKSSQPYSPSR
jgi:hypothetical protein